MSNNFDEIWADDFLKHQEYSSVLGEHVARAAQMNTWLALNGEWGSGKTFLLNRWQKEYNKKYLSLYIDAALDDGMEDNPLLSVIGQIHIYINNDGVEEAVRDSLLPIIDNVIKHYTGANVADIKSQGESIFDSYSKEKENEQYLYDKLSDIAKKIYTETGFPLVVVIDNLDRCVPDFAIRLLERIKFLDEINGLVVIWGVNCSELEKSICRVLGDMRGDDYLRKFWQNTIDMPQTSGYKYGVHLFEKYKISHSCLTDQHKDYWPGSPDPDDFDKYDFWLKGNEELMRKIWNGGWKDMITCFPYLVSCLHLTLREIEEAVNLFNWVLREECFPNFPVNIHYPSIITYLILLKISNKKLYNDFILGKVNGNDIISYFISEIRNQYNDHDFHMSSLENFYFIEHYVIFSFINNCSKDVKFSFLDVFLTGEDSDVLFSHQSFEKVKSWFPKMTDTESKRKFMETNLEVIKELDYEKFLPEHMNSIINYGKLIY